MDVSIVAWVAGSTLHLEDPSRLHLEDPSRISVSSPRLGDGTSHQHKIGRATKTSDANVPQLRS